MTDANLVLGYLNPDDFAGGTMRLHPAAPPARIEERLARPLGLSLEEAAWGIHTIVNTNMELATRVVSIERGRDPRTLTLVAFGGSGPVHGCRLAQALERPARDPARRRRRDRGHRPARRRGPVRRRPHLRAAPRRADPAQLEAMYGEMTGAGGRVVRESAAPGG